MPSSKSASRSGFSPAPSRQLAGQLRPLLAERPQVGADVGERVVDLVRDAGRELADRGEARRGEEALAEAEHLAQIAHEDDERRSACRAGRAAARSRARPARATPFPRSSHSISRISRGGASAASGR